MENKLLKVNYCYILKNYSNDFIQCNYFDENVINDAFKNNELIIKLYNNKFIIIKKNSLFKYENNYYIPPMDTNNLSNTLEIINEINCLTNCPNNFIYIPDFDYLDNIELDGDDCEAINFPINELKTMEYNQYGGLIYGKFTRSCIRCNRIVLFYDSGVWYSFKLEQTFDSIELDGNIPEYCFIKTTISKKYN